MNSLYAGIAATIAFGVTALLGIWMIPFLHKLKFGQTIKEIGPKWHQKKQGTPTMGGIMFIIGISLGTMIFVPFLMASGGETTLSFAGVTAGLLMAVAYGLVGFMDDFISIKKHRNLGLTEIQKLVLQFLIAGAYLFSMWIAGADTATMIPFIGRIDLGFFYYILAALIIVGMVNAVNFTDGIDGLNGTVTFVVCLFSVMIASYMHHGSLAVFAAASAGGCLGFLVWNFNPAKVFMGDTGSLFLGGIVCALCFAMDMPILLLPLGIVYICEILSVVLQVTYFKATHGKRLFKMSPIHHHFEMCGWTEKKICAVFGSVSAIGGVLSLLAVIFGGF